MTGSQRRLGHRFPPRVFTQVGTLFPSPPGPARGVCLRQRGVSVSAIGHKKDLTILSIRQRRMPDALNFAQILSPRAIWNELRFRVGPKWRDRNRFQYENGPRWQRTKGILGSESGVNDSRSTRQSYLRMLWGPYSTSDWIRLIAPPPRIRHCCCGRNHGI